MSEELTLGQKLKNFRKKANLSQFELEDKIEASPGSLSRIENGQINPTKETILKIIDTLGLSPSEASSLFNIDLSLEKELRKVVDVSLTLNKTHDLNEMLDIIINKISLFAGGNAATLWLWDEKSKELKLERIMTTPKVTKFVEKVIKVSTRGIILSKYNNEHIKNHYLKCMNNEEAIISYKLYDLAYTILNETMSSIVSKWLHFKTAVSLPLITSDKKIGVFSIVWNADYITQKDIFNIQAYADQIAIAIYNAKKYDEINKKYLELKNKYER